VARYPDDALCAPILEVLGYFLALSPLTHILMQIVIEKLLLLWF
jgi:hypothetical protein